MSIEVGSGLSDLVAILRAGLSPRSRFPASVLDWSVVVRLADEHRLSPFVAKLVRERGVGVPERTKAALDQGLASATIASLGALATLREIGDGFATAKVRWIAWKGPALSQRAWGDAARRRYDDLDLVVHPADVARAREVLATLGWRSVHRAMSARQAGVVLAGQRAHELVRDVEGLPLELHWGFGARRYAGFPSVEDVIGRAMTMRVGGVDLRVATPFDEIVLHAVHATKHGWSRLEDVVLFARLAEDAAALSEATALARRTGGTRALALGIALAGRIFPTSSPAHGSRRALERPLARMVDAVITRWQDEDTGWRSTLRWDLAWTDGARRRARLLLHSTFDVTLQEWRFVRLPDALVGLYPLVRPLRLVARSLGLTRDG